MGSAFFASSPVYYPQSLFSLSCRNLTPTLPLPLPLPLTLPHCYSVSISVFLFRWSESASGIVIFILIFLTSLFPDRLFFLFAKLKVVFKDGHKEAYRLWVRSGIGVENPPREVEEEMEIQKTHQAACVHSFSSLIFILFIFPFNSNNLLSSLPLVSQKTATSSQKVFSQLC